MSALIRSSIFNFEDDIVFKCHICIHFS